MPASQPLTGTQVDAERMRSRGQSREDHRRSSREAAALIADCEMTATSIVSSGEVVAALATAARIGVLRDDVVKNARQKFTGDWPDIVRVPVTEALLERAGGLAWDHGRLRGYEAAGGANHT